MALPFILVARRALAQLVLRGQLGRVATVIRQYGSGVQAMRYLRPQFAGYPLQVRQYILRQIAKGVGLGPRPGRKRLFLKDIPIIRGLFQKQPFGTRVRYGVDVDWLNTTTGQSGTVFRQIDEPAPVFDQVLKEVASEMVTRDLSDSPRAFGITGEPDIVITSVDTVYVFRGW